MAADEQARTADDKAGMFLTFFLAEEEFGLEILSVREIIGLQNITPVPRTPPHILGVINLRGKVIPTIDLRTKFGMQTIESTDETCIIVVCVGEVEVGVLVDKVSEVMDILGKDIEEAPSFGTGVDTKFILGMGKVQDRVVILLEIQRVINIGELEHVGALSGQTAEEVAAV
jgi:purine-binding chemotaxis protein CheW